MPNGTPAAVEPAAETIDLEREYRRLRSFCRQSDGFALGLAVYADPALRDAVLRRLSEDLARDGVAAPLVEVAGAAAEDGLLGHLRRAKAAAAGPAAFQVVGIERHLTFLGRKAPRDDGLVQQANLQRELFRDRIGAPILLWCSPLSVNAIATQAPDLWHWRSGLFLFLREEGERLAALQRQRPEPFPQWQPPPGPELPRRLAHLRELLAELERAGTASRQARTAKAGLLFEIADLQQRLGDWAAALEGFRAAAELRRGLDEARAAAVAMSRAADVLRDRGEQDEALRIWREEVLPVFERLGDVRQRAAAIGKIANVLQDRGELEQALRIRREEQLPVFERLGDARSRAIAMGKIADILQARGELEEALRIRKEEELPVYERLGDIWSWAVTMGQIADVLQARGELEEALRIRMEEELPIYERLGNARSQAVAMGGIADVMQARGELEEALRIRREEQLPVYERLGDVRERAVTMSKIADVLRMRGELEEALRIWREEVLPAYERLDDAQSWAGTMGKIADVLQDRGDLEEALLIWREEMLPVYQRLGDAQSRAGTMGRIADVLQEQGDPEETLRIWREEVLPVFERLGDVRERAVTLGKIADALLRGGGLEQGREAEIAGLLAESFETMIALQLREGIAWIAQRYAAMLRDCGRDAEALAVIARATAALAGREEGAGAAALRALRAEIEAAARPEAPSGSGKHGDPATLA